MDNSLARLAAVAVALTGFAFLAPAHAGAFDECGKGGYGTASCPDFGVRKQRPRPAPQIEMRYELPQDECLRAGYGTVMCPKYGTEEAARPAESSGNQKVKGSYVPPKDECGKSGWGITACPGFGSRK